jgi:hypothetical protein
MFYTMPPLPVRPAALVGRYSQAWLFPYNYTNSGGGNDIFLWGPRPAQACQSAYVGVGSQPAWGAGGHYSCDSAWAQSPQTQQDPTNSNGWRPTTYTWHHLVVAYTGATGTPAYTETYYLDGAINVVYSARQLGIVRSQNLILGCEYQSSAYMSDSIVAIGRLRMHDGALTGAQVAYNYNAEKAIYFPTPSSTPTASVSGSITPSHTPSPSSTQVRRDAAGPASMGAVEL